MRLAKNQIILAIDASSWHQIRFSNDFVLLYGDQNRSENNLLLKDNLANIVAQGSLDEIYPQIKTFAPICMYCSSSSEGKVATRVMNDGYLVCLHCSQLIDKYYHCSECKTPLNNPALSSFLRKRHETADCGSDICKKNKEVRRGRLCCMKAEYIDCVCERAYQCPEHAPEGVHFGTHD